MCYLPLNTFLLRPLHRLMHYKQVLERLCKHHPPSHADFRDCRGKDACAQDPHHCPCPLQDAVPTGGISGLSNVAASRVSIMLPS